MRKKLAVIAVTGFAVSALCLGGAFALGGGQLGDAVFNLGNIGDDFGLPRCDISGSPVATEQTRSMAWDGDEGSVAIAIPATVHYQAGMGDQLIVKGDPALISHVRVHDGTVDIDCRHGMFGGSTRRIDVTLPGQRNFKKFEMLGSGDMQLSGLSQSEAKMEIAGSGTIETEGNVDNLNLEIDGSGTVQSKGQTNNVHAEISGSGKMLLAELQAHDANIEISGSGRVDVAPQNKLDVDISGSGTIYLHSEPKSIESDFSGSGKIVHTNGTVEDKHERHAELEKAYRHRGVYADSDANGDEIKAVVQDAVRNGRAPDPDAIRAAQEKLEAKIRAKVARELDKVDLNDDDDRR
jgi:Putative auto-transporter adhesin, head GIN domain